jgi:hypothetical protein
VPSTCALFAQAELNMQVGFCLFFSSRSLVRIRFTLPGTNSRSDFGSSVYLLYVFSGHLLKNTCSISYSSNLKKSDIDLNHQNGKSEVRH